MAQPEVPTTTWLDGDTIAAYWNSPPSSPLIDDLLASAKSALLKWRRENAIADPPPEDDVPANLRLAQAMLARSTWESQRASADSDEIGSEQAVRVYPMDAKTKRLALADVDHGIVVA